MRGKICAPLALALALAASGCNGPKDTCEGTMSSFKGCVNSGNDWECFCELMHPAQRAKFGDKMITRWAIENWVGAKNFKWDQMQADTTGNICIVRTVSSWTVKVRGKKPEDHEGEFNAYTLHVKDGIWYLDVPGSQKLTGF